MSVLSGAGPTEVLLEVETWARQLAKLYREPEGGKYHTIAQDLAEGRADTALELIRHDLFAWALSRSGYQLEANGMITDASPLDAETDKSAVTAIKKFAPWVTKLQLLENARLRPSGL